MIHIPFDILWVLLAGYSTLKRIRYSLHKTIDVFESNERAEHC